MQDLIFRKKLIWNEINHIKSELNKNYEYIDLFQKQNKELVASLENKFKELEIVGDKLLENETKALISAGI